MGVEPTCSAWEADILPMNYIRVYMKYSILLLRLQECFNNFRNCLTKCFVCVMIILVKNTERDVCV